jgi:hypothetical protein
MNKHRVYTERERVKSKDFSTFLFLIKTPHFLEEPLCTVMVYAQSTHTPQEGGIW